MDNPMKYKALMLDVDGTIIPYDYEAIPSDKVADAIHKAQKHVTVCLVTGRSFAFTQGVMNKLKINSGYAVVNNGAQVINIATKEILHEQLIDADAAKEIITFFRSENFPVFVKGSPFVQEYIQDFSVDLADNFQPSMIFTPEIFSSDQADGIMKKLSHLSTVTINKTHHKEQGKFGLLICHVDASKANGIFHLEKHIHVSPSEMIGVGDGYNDFPLLMACGLKVAMGNAVEDLKAIADYIAPTVEENGVVDVIERFILNTKY